MKNLIPIITLTISLVFSLATKARAERVTYYEEDGTVVIIETDLLDEPRLLYNVNREALWICPTSPVTVVSPAPSQSGVRSEARKAARRTTRRVNRRND